MAFHVACPITCRRICFCLLGFPRELQREKAKDEFLERVGRVEDFLKDPWLLKVKDERTVQVAVPKVVAPPPPAAPVDGAAGGCGGGIEGEEMLSAQTKRVAMQRKAAAASLVAEDYARRFESGDLLDAGDLPGEEQGQSNVKVMCRLCFFGENEGSERAGKMLSCKSCGKKYHRSCLKAWAQHRDLFHWSSWTCPSCRICEVCRRAGDPNKFMFCKRCDGAYHCYCQQPPHKNVGSGPYLCPKHTRCHSCGSTVSGNGLSTRWFLGYTCCDACGRLFVKGNYCPVCLKVYRDSESTPMVCCDACQRWVHCQCDGISDEKYLQFQVDGNLQYVCATCRGECYKVQDLEDAVQELWRRRDLADQDLIASLRAAVGLPTQEEIFSISPFSDDEENDSLMLKNEYNRSLKFSLKGLVDKSPKKAKEYGKKSTNKKYAKKGHQRSSIGKTEAHQSFEGHSDTPSFGYSVAGDNNDDTWFHRSEKPFPSHAAGSLTEGICSVNQVGVLKQRYIDEVAVSIDNAKSKAKSSRPHGLDSGDDTGKNAGISMTAKGPKLVIHLGGRNRNSTNSPGSDASSYQREQDLTTFTGSEDMGEQRAMEKHMQDRNDATAELGNGKGNKFDCSDELKGLKLGRERNSLKIRKISSEIHDVKPKFGGGNVPDGHEAVSPVTSSVPLGKRSIEGNRASVGNVNEVAARRGEKVYLRKYEKDGPDVHDDINDNGLTPSISHSLPKDSKPLLKLKFKNPYHENQSSWTPNGEDDKSSVKGQRSKRKRSSPFMEKKLIKDDEDFSKWYGDGTMDAIMDANWILQKLGQDAIGKRVEVHQPSDNSWHKGTVTDVTEGTPFVSVALDDGKDKILELGKQGIRFVSQKQKR